MEGEKNDRYGRLVGKVLVNGGDANLAQIQTGMAWHYKQYQREQSAEDRQTYAAAEDAAKSKKLGLWAENDPVAPWDWRKDRRGKVLFWGAEGLAAHEWFFLDPLTNHALQ